jgi:hypothetical protein
VPQPAPAQPGDHLQLVRGLVPRQRVHQVQRESERGQHGGVREVLPVPERVQAADAGGNGQVHQFERERRTNKDFVRDEEMILLPVLGREQACYAGGHEQDKTGGHERPEHHFGQAVLVVGHEGAYGGQHDADGAGVGESADGVGGDDFALGLQHNTHYPGGAIDLI